MTTVISYFAIGYHGNLLNRLREAADAWIRQRHNYQGQLNNDDPDYDDFRVTDRPSGRVMFRVNYLHNKGQSASLELLGSPQEMAVAESLCGMNFVPIYDSMVFKEENDGAPIIWHQDAIHPRHYRIFNYDIYLDESVAEMVPCASYREHSSTNKISANWKKTTECNCC